MRRSSRVATALFVLVAACSGGADPTTTTAPATTTTAPASTATLPADSTAAPTSVPELQGAGRLTEASARGIGDDYFPTLGNPGYDVAHYTLDLVFDPEDRFLAGVATIAATATTDLDIINFDLTRMEASTVFVDGMEAPFTAAGQDLIVAPPTPIPTGEDFVVEVEYSGRPGSTTSAALPFGIGWTTVGDQNYVVAEPDGAHSWFPGNDHPLDKATFTFRITVPDDVAAVANGTFVEKVTDLGTATWIWEMPQPMATYLATVVIGDFEVVEDEAGSAESGIPIRHVLPSGTDLGDWPGIERHGEMLVLLEDLFGPYPFDNYGIAIVDGFGAALENQTISLFDSNLARSGFFEFVMIHELAHQWFGNSVTPTRWQDIWLNEGFASYAEWMWQEHTEGFDAVAREIADERNSFENAGLRPPGEPPVADLFNAAVYRVGAMTLHALRLTVGDEAFHNILRAYAERFAYSNATTADFIDISQEVSGQDLTELFESWLYGETVPDFPSR